MIKKKIYLYTAVGSACLLALTGCDQKQKTAEVQQRIIPVSVIEVISQDVPADIEFVAKTESSRAVEINSRVSGFLDEKKYVEGGIVQEGQVLFTMDAKPFEVQLKEAEAALASSEAAHTVAEQNLERIRPLAKLKALSQSDLDNAEGQFQTTAASVSDAKAKVESAKLDLSYCTITSPVTGYAGAALQTDGTYINMGNAHLTTVYAMDPMWVTFSMSENQEAKLGREVREGLLKVPSGDEFLAEVHLTDGRIYKYPGKLTFASPNYNPNTGTFEIRASFPNPKNVLRPQQYVRVVVKGATYPNSIIVPQESVMQGTKGHFVWVINKDNKAENRPVAVGEWIESDWLITGGLQAGDRVVTEGMMMLGPDATVKIVKDEKQKPIEREEEKEDKAVDSGVHFQQDTNEAAAAANPPPPKDDTIDQSAPAQAVPEQTPPPSQPAAAPAAPAKKAAP